MLGLERSAAGGLDITTLGAAAVPLTSKTVAVVRLNMPEEALEPFDSVRVSHTAASYPSAEAS